MYRIVLYMVRSMKFLFIQLISLALRSRGAKIGKNVTFVGLPRIRMRDLSKLEIGEESIIESGVTMWQGNNGSISIGNRCYIGIGTIINSNTHVSVGDETLVGAYCIIQDNNHMTDIASTIRSQGNRSSPITIGSDCWIGAQSCILMGITIGDHTIVGANSVVNRDVAPLRVVAGSPARVIKERR